MPNEPNLAAIVAALGHHSVGVTEHGHPERGERDPENGHRRKAGEMVTSYRWTCSCGYVTTNRRTFTLAVEAAVHHFRKVGAEAARQGFQLGHDTPNKQDPPKRSAGVA